MKDSKEPNTAQKEGTDRGGICHFGLPAQRLHSIAIHHNKTKYKKGLVT